SSDVCSSDLASWLEASGLADRQFSFTYCLPQQLCLLVILRLYECVQRFGELAIRSMDFSCLAPQFTQQIREDLAFWSLQIIYEVAFENFGQCGTETLLRVGRIQEFSKSAEGFTFGGGTQLTICFKNLADSYAFGGGSVQNAFTQRVEHILDAIAHAAEIRRQAGRQIQYGAGRR